MAASANQNAVLQLAPRLSLGERAYDEAGVQLYLRRDWQARGAKHQSASSHAPTFMWFRARLVWHRQAVVTASTQAEDRTHAGQESETHDEARGSLFLMRDAAGTKSADLWVWARTSCAPSRMPAVQEDICPW